MLGRKINMTSGSGLVSSYTRAVMLTREALIGSKFGGQIQIHGLLRSGFWMHVASTEVSHHPH